MVSDEQINNFKWAVANDLRTTLVSNCPVDTGRLKNSIKVEIVGSDIIIDMVDYALYVEFGTPPHIIRPKNKKALHWKTGKPGSPGREDVFAKEVRHPGTRPNPFIRNTFKKDFITIIKNNADLLGGDETTIDVEV